MGRSKDQKVTQSVIMTALALSTEHNVLTLF